MITWTSENHAEVNGSPHSAWTARGQPDWVAVSREPVPGVEAEQTHPRAMCRSSGPGEAAHRKDPKPSLAEQQQYLQFRETGMRGESRRKATRRKSVPGAQNLGRNTFREASLSFILQIFIENLPCSRNCTRHRRFIKSNQKRHSPCSCGTCDGRWEWGRG